MTPDEPAFSPAQPDRATGSLKIPVVEPVPAPEPEAPQPKPGFFARDIVLRAGELTILLVAVVGAIALGLGITDYFVEHRLMLGYLVAYVGYRYADLLIREEFHDGPAREELSRRIGSQLPLLVMFAGAAFERTYIYRGDAPRWSIMLGLLLAVVGLWMDLGARIQMGFYTTGSDDRPVLVHTALFRSIRHPTFLGAFLIVIGWPLVMGAPIAFALTVVITWMSLRRQILDEEKLLLATFGEEYELYMRRTDAMIPYIW